MVLTRAAIDAILANIIETGNEFDPVTTFIGLFSAIVDTGAATVLADITPLDATAFPRQEITTWSAVRHLADGRAVADGPLMRFSPPDGTTPSIAIGWYAATALTAGALLAFGYFPAGGYSLPDNTREVVFIMRITVDPAGRWSAEESFNG